MSHTITAPEAIIPHQQKIDMIQKAKEKHGYLITGINHKKNGVLEDSFFIIDNLVTLWYNDVRGSTHIEKEPIVIVVDIQGVN